MYENEDETRFFLFIIKRPSYECAYKKGVVYGGPYVFKKIFFFLVSALA